MANYLKMGQQETILSLHQQGWSKRKIARELGVDRGAVRRILRECHRTHEATVSENSKPPTPCEVLTGAEGAVEAKPPTPAQVLTGTPCAAAVSLGHRSKCEAHRELIEQKLDSSVRTPFLQRCKSSREGGWPDLATDLYRAP
jgi:DNA-binding transcriptional regulator LsrR (DeoR family)